MLTKRKQCLVRLWSGRRNQFAVNVLRKRVFPPCEVKFDRRFSLQCYTMNTESYRICWLASLRILSTSLPFSSSSLVRVLMFSLSVWIWWSSWAMWFFLLITSSCNSEIRPNSSRSCEKRNNKNQLWRDEGRKGLAIRLVMLILKLIYMVEYFGNYTLEFFKVGYFEHV